MYVRKGMYIHILNIIIYNQKHLQKLQVISCHVQSWHPSPNLLFREAHIGQWIDLGELFNSPTEIGCRMQFTNMILWTWWLCPTCRKSLLSPHFRNILPNIWFFVCFEFPDHWATPGTRHQDISSCNHFCVKAAFRHLESLGTAASLIRRRTSGGHIARKGGVWCQARMNGNLQKVINCC